MPDDTIDTERRIRALERLADIQDRSADRLTAEATRRRNLAESYHQQAMDLAATADAAAPWPLGSDAHG